MGWNRSKIGERNGRVKENFNSKFVWMVGQNKTASMIKAVCNNAFNNNSVYKKILKI